MRAVLDTFQPESTRIKASPKRENPIKTKDQYRLRNFFRRLVAISFFFLMLQNTNQETGSTRHVSTFPSFVCLSCFVAILSFHYGKKLSFSLGPVPLAPSIDISVLSANHLCLMTFKT